MQRSKMLLVRNNLYKFGNFHLIALIFYAVLNLYLFLAHINYIKKYIGVDHIGIGGDYNGVSE